MENNNHKTALLFGSTGLVGSYCLTYLLQNKNYDKVISFSRSSPADIRKKSLIENEKLKSIIIDFNNISKFENEIKGEDVFYCVGSTIKKAGTKENFKKIDLDYTIEIARAAFKNGVKQFLIVTAIDANPKSKLFYNRIKGLVEKEISKINFKSISIFRPSVILGERDEFRIKEIIAKPMFKLFSFALTGKYKRYLPIEAQTIALAMVKTADKNLTGINIFETEEIKNIASSNKNS